MLFILIVSLCRLHDALLIHLSSHPHIFKLAVIQAPQVTHGVEVGLIEILSVLRQVQVKQPSADCHLFLHLLFLNQLLGIINASLHISLVFKHMPLKLGHSQLAFG